MKKAIIIGATSGIGCALAKKLHREGYFVAITGRRENLLSQIAGELKERCVAYYMDVSDQDSARECFAKIVEEIGERKNGEINLVVVCAGVAKINFELDWPTDKNLIDVNVAGFTAISIAAFDLFRRQDQGHLVGISSVAGLRGVPHVAAYSASKSYCSTYLSALRALAVREKKNIAITDVRPGFVDTALVFGSPTFWTVSPETAAEQIFHAIRKKKKTAYVPKRWNLIALGMQIIPDWLYFQIVNSK